MQPSRAMISTDYEIVRSLGTRFTKLPNLLVASLLMLACSPPKQEAGAAQPQAKPSWRVELAKIFQGPDEFILDVMPVDDFVAVIRTDVWVRPGQPRIGWTKSCRVKAAVLDARNGGVLVSRVLFPDQDGDACDVRPSTAIGEKGIYVAYGQTLVRTDWALKTQASADLSKISVTELSQPGGAHWEVFYTERDGQLVLACSAGKALYWLDPATLSTQFIKQLVAPIRKLGLSGDKVIYLPLTKTGADLRSLFVETQESQQSSAVPAEVLMAVAGDGCFMAVANDERFISDRRGQVCWREPQPKNGGLWAWAATESCRFVIPQSGGVPIDGKGNTADTLQVRDCSREFLNLSLPGNVRHDGAGVTAFTGPKAGLSPDGRFLAVITGNGVELYRVSD